VTARRGAEAVAVLLAGWLAGWLLAASPAAADPIPPRGVLVVFVPGVSFEQLLAHPAVRSLAASGGAALVPASGEPSAAVRRAFPKTSVYPLGGGTIDLRLLVLEQGFGPSAPPLAELDEQLRRTVARFDVGEILVAVVGERPSASMRARKDDLLPMVVGIGSPRTLLESAGPPRGLTSDSTRRPGVVVAGDLPATIASFVGHPIAGNPFRVAQAAGFPIRFVDAPAPFELHRRYLAMRRMTVPVQTAAALYVTIAGLFGLGVLWAGRRAPAALGVIASGAAISVGPLAAALLATGHLPTASYATVVPLVVVVTAAVTGLVLLGATRGLLHPILPLGALLLAFLLVEDLLGWTAALTPFLGGSELDGGRSFGLPNVFIGLLLGASLYAAARLPAWGGFAILLAAALLAGLPLAGANLGGAVTLLAAAGLWLPLRARGRLHVPELAFAAAVVVVGTGLVLVAHRLSSLPTHVTTFEETRGLGGAWSTLIDRLGVGRRLIARNPFALVPVIGVLATLGVVLRPPGSIARSLERHPAFRDALLVILLGSVVAYVVNDSGPAACGVGFGMALGGILYVSVSERTWKMVSA
jgi:hypothetical protein